MQQQQFINNFNQLNMFRAIISPILRSSLWYNAPAMLPAGASLANRQQYLFDIRLLLYVQS